MEVNSGNRNELKEKHHSEAMNFLVKNLNDISAIIRLTKTKIYGDVSSLFLKSACI